QNFEYVLEMRRVFLDIIQYFASIKINTDLENSYPGILSVTFLGVKCETLLALVDVVCMSMGSACNSQAVEPSHVLSAIG
ncbi:IscS subfamily cysteine desulfurase, partial [Francisella tularensis subsp. holarctica]|nr:IscS subfamily cysteine desulfurase [Francisella tularensis subsp. holarctica]